MDSKLWIRKVLSMCLSVAIIATYSTVALAGSDKVAGEISISGKTANGENLFVKINGENAQSGRSIFTGSTVATPENASVVVNLGKAGRIELAPNTIMRLSFDEKAVAGDLSAGRVTVLNSLNSMTVNTSNGKSVALNEGQSASAPNAQAQTDNNGGGGGFLIYAVILGGAVAGIVYAATSDNKVALGGGSTVVSTTR